MTELKHLTGIVKRVDRSGSFEAVIATLGVIDSDGDIIEPGAFGDATIPIVPAHNQSSVPLGKAKMEDRGNEAIAVGQFNLDIQAGREWHSALKFDMAATPIQEWSFGFRIRDFEDGIQDGQRVRFLKKMDVIEISPVLRGAGINTRTVAVKHRSTDDFGAALSEFEENVSSLGELLQAATPGQLQDARPVVEPLIGRFGSFANEMLGGKDDVANLLFAKSVATEAAIVLDDLDRERFKYAFCDVDDSTQESAASIAEFVAASLGIDAPAIKFFRPVELGCDADFGYRDEINGLAVGGDTLGGRPTIFVRAASLGSIVGTIAHETRHVWQRLKGWDMGDKDRIESDAYAFGNSFKAQLDLPENADDLIVSDGAPPLKHGTYGGFFSTFHLNRKTGHLYRAIGDAPNPRWNYYKSVNIGAL